MKAALLALILSACGGGVAYEGDAQQLAVPSHINVPEQVSNK